VIRSWPRFWSLVPVVSAVFFASHAALGAAHDADAAKLREAAIYSDYLATDFASAEKKLTQALALCEKPVDCSSATRARLRCDLGVVEFASQKIADGRAQFALAVKEDPNIELDGDLTTPELQKELGAAKANGASKRPVPDAGKAGEETKELGPAKPNGASKPAAADAGPSAEGNASAGGEPAAAAAAAPVTPSPSEGDCPPGFPGCKSSESSGSCSNDDDCGPGEKCEGGSCQDTHKITGTPGRANWLSLSFQLDTPILPARSNVCAGKKGYSCFNTDGSWYSQTPAQGGGGEVQSAGLQPGTMRVLLGYDRALFNNVTLGGAVGFAFNGGPTRPGGTAFLPLSAEVRAKFWLGHYPLGRAGFRFYGMLDGGFADVAASLTTYVYATPSSQPVAKDAWYHMGRGYAGIGLGSMLAINPNMGIFLELRAMELFPTAGTALAAQFGYALSLF
jgi:hypothetical protein